MHNNKFHQQRHILQVATIKNVQSQMNAEGFQYLRHENFKQQEIRIRRYRKTIS